MTAASSFPFSTTDLIQVVPTLKRPQKFLLDKFFPNIQSSETEFVAIDIDVGLRRMAPFISPLVQGKLVEQRRYQTNTYKPAYIKDKRAPDLRKPIAGCVFAGRCALATDLCRQYAPGLEEKGPRHIAACHYAAKGAVAA